MVFVSFEITVGHFRGRGEIAVRAEKCGNIVRKASETERFSRFFRVCPEIPIEKAGKSGYNDVETPAFYDERHWGGDARMRSEEDVVRAVEQYADTVRRICYYYLKNEADTEDIFQNVFMKYMLRDEPFENEEHEKAWLLRVAINACKDYLKSFFRRNTVPLEVLNEVAAEVPEEHREVMEAVLSLPQKYKDPIYLHYYEGYSAAEIGSVLGKKENTVYSLLARGRKRLKEKLGGEGIGESDT